jgi:hypothetical protein
MGLDAGGGEVTSDIATVTHIGQRATDFDRSLRFCTGPMDVNP